MRSYEVISGGLAMAMLCGGGNALATRGCGDELVLTPEAFGVKITEEVNYSYAVEELQRYRSQPPISLGKVRRLAVRGTLRGQQNVEQVRYLDVTTLEQAQEILRRELGDRLLIASFDGPLSGSLPKDLSTLRLRQNPIWVVNSIGIPADMRAIYAYARSSGFRTSAVVSSEAIETFGLDETVDVNLLIVVTEPGGARATSSPALSLAHAVGMGVSDFCFTGGEAAVASLGEPDASWYRMAPTTFHNPELRGALASFLVGDESRSRWVTGIVREVPWYRDDRYDPPHGYTPFVIGGETVPTRLVREIRVHPRYIDFLDWGGRDQP